MTDNSVTIKSIDEQTAVVAGYGIVFGGKDLEADTFDRDTELELDMVPSKSVFYDHTIGSLKHALGKVLSATVDDTGVWIEAELQRSKAYVAEVLKLIEKGVLGWSSGSVSHLVRREGGVIKSWPVVEFSLTPTPCEPRTLGVERIKALAEDDDKFKAFLPQVVGETTANASDAPTEAVQTVETKTEVSHMDENEIKALVGQAAKAAATEAVDAFKASLPAVTSGIVVTKDEADRGFKSFGEQLKAIRDAAIRPSSVDPRLLAINDKAFKATGASEGTSSDGGFLIQQDFANEVLGRVYNTGAILSRVNRRQIGAGSNGLVVNVVNETSRADGSRFGGARAYWLAEGGTKTSSKPTYRRFSLNLEKLIGLYYATDELLQDNVALAGEVSDMFAQELQFAAEDAVVNGTGVGQPLGVVGHAATVSITKEVGQAAATVVTQNVMKAWARMWAPDRANAVWFINQDVEPQLFQMSLAVGTAGVPVYLPANGLSGQPYSTLLGRPVIPVEYCATLGTVGDVILANFAAYRFIEKSAIQGASSIHLAFTTDETAFRWVWRVNGAPFDASALTPHNGNNTLGHFVTIATRA